MFDKRLVKSIIDKQLQLQQNSSTKKWDFLSYKNILKEYKQVLKQMVNARMHLGHKPSSWNSKMKPFIYKKHKNLYIINLLETAFRLEQASQILTYLASQNKKFLFIGTQKHTTQLMEQVARSCNSYFVNEKWLGGMITNWQTIRKSVKKLIDLESMDQKDSLLLDLSKKEIAANKKEKEKLTRYLGGLKGMVSVPDVVIIVGQPKDINGVRECRKKGLLIITLVDTDCDPSLTDLIIPTNDDSIRSTSLVLNKFLQSIQKGQQLYQDKLTSTSKTSRFLHVV